MFNPQSFGTHLAQLRKDAGLTQSALADKLHLTRQAVSRYEQGNSVPDISILVLMADVFHITLDQLIIADGQAELVKLAEYFNGDNVFWQMEEADFYPGDDKAFEKLLPYLDAKGKNVIFQKILNGEMDWQRIRVLLPHAEYLISQVEAAVMEGALPKEALEVVQEYVFMPKL